MQVLILLLIAALSFCADRADPRLKSVGSVFVKGNNQAAERARESLRQGKTCFTLAGKAEDADAIMEIATETQSQGGVFGSMGARAWIASATLTLKSGDLVWSRSERFSDAPFMSGGKTAGDLLLNRLAKDAGCKERLKQSVRSSGASRPRL